MTVADVCTLVGKIIHSGYVHNGVIVLLVSSFLLEFSQTKIKPWSWLVKKFGSIANADVMKRLSDMERDIRSLKERNDKQDEKNLERDAIAARREILKFGDSLRHGVEFSKESYEQVLVDIDNYEAYCREHPEFKNNKTLSAKKKIISEYERCDATNDFLN